MREKIMLIAGCSHTAGSEIDGEIDSVLNRNLSYGNVLAKKLGYTPINIAVGGSTNGAIARSVLDWFQNHDTSDKEVFVLVGWTESSRVDAPYQYPTWHGKSAGGKFAEWTSPTSVNYLHINLSYNFYSDREKDIQEDYKKFIVKHLEFFEVYTANLILQLQYFFKHSKIKYLMVNTMHTFSPENEPYLKCYWDMIDKSNYYKLLDNAESFYAKYKDPKYNSFRNPKALYGHHGVKPHGLYSEELYNFLMEKQNDTTN